MKKKMAIGLVILAVGVIGYWMGTGSHIFTQTQVQVQGEPDELFGTTTTEWKDEFHPGLEFVAPISIISLLAAGWLVWRSRKESRKESRALLA